MSTDLSPIPASDGEVIQKDWMAEHAHPIDRLREAIQNLEFEEGRLAALAAAQDRAREQSYLARSNLSEAEGALKRTQRDDPQRVAYAFLNRDEALTFADPLADAKAQIEADQAEVKQLDGIEAAIAQEIARVQFEIRQLRSIRDRRMAEYLVDSEEFQHLLMMHRDCWLRLRSVRAALKLISEACHGQMPSPYDTEWNRSEPLEQRVGYGVNEGFIECWAEALKELEHSADCELPLFG